MKSAKDFLAEADAAVPRITPEEGIAKHQAGETIFVDVRDGESIRSSGTIAGAVHVPRGMVEFIADPSHNLHNPALRKDTELVLICGAGGQAALAGKTLKDMGYQTVLNVGGFSAWKDAGGPVDES